MTIHQLGALFSTAYIKAAISATATNSFKHTGICPFNLHIFPNYMFAAAETTDRPAPPDGMYEVNLIQDPGPVEQTEHSGPHTQSQALGITNRRNPIPGPSTSDDPIPRSSPSDDQAVGPSTSDDPIPGPSTSDGPMAGPSTSDDPMPGPSTSDYPHLGLSEQILASEQTAATPARETGTELFLVLSTK